MDKELKENIEKLAQAERLIDEEKMATDSVIGAIEVNEDIEDKEYLINQLKKKYKFWKVNFIIALIILIIIMLYMLHTYILARYDSDASPVITQEVNQEISEFYVRLQELPLTEINRDCLTIRTLGEFKDIGRHGCIRIGGHSFFQWEDDISSIECTCDGTGDHTTGRSVKHNIDWSTEIVTREDFYYALAHTNATYQLVDSLEELPSRCGEAPIYCIDYADDDREDVYFYSSDTISGVSLEDTILGKTATEVITLCTIYGDYDPAVVEDIVLDAWSEVAVLSAIKLYNNGNYKILSYEDVYDEADAINASIKKIKEVYGVDSVTQNEQGQYVVTKDGKTYIPETVTQVQFQYVRVEHDYINSAYYYGWF